MIFPERLVEVAAIASRSTAATPRLEVYPHGLDAGRALRLAAGAALRQHGAHARAGGRADRFPHAAALPGRPDLDALLESAGVPLRWDDDARQYLARRVEAHGLTSLATYRGTTPRRGTGGTVAMTKAGWRRVEDRVLAMDDRLARVERCLPAQEVTVLDVESALLAGCATSASVTGWRGRGCWRLTRPSGCRVNGPICRRSRRPA